MLSDEDAVMMTKIHRLIQDKPDSNRLTGYFDLLIPWLRDSEFNFESGPAYRKECDHDDTPIDWSMMDDHVIPIYLAVNHKRLGFLQDVVVKHKGQSGFGAVSALAATILSALNQAVSDPDWRLCHLPGVLDTLG
jgi:hypothetical protein